MQRVRFIFMVTLLSGCSAPVGKVTPNPLLGQNAEVAVESERPGDHSTIFRATTIRAWDALIFDSQVAPNAAEGEALSRKWKQNIEGWIARLSQNPASLRRALERGRPYQAQVEWILKQHGVPAELYYLTILESGFTCRAVSRSRASGIWQFLRSTARHYGLVSNRYLDERRDILRSSTAAARYLHDLYQRLGSWALVAAAYNAGGHRIERAIRENHSRDFWTLAENDSLPGETVRFVPRLLAMVAIAKDPSAYGFEKTAPRKSLPDLTRVRVPSGMRLERIAEFANVSVVRLRSWNPQLLLGVTPPHGRGCALWVSRATAKKLPKTWLRMVTWAGEEEAPEG